ncbi:BTB domain-containing protein [Favolaschia claudopus]|uniref:BTB domain-containing protein n=1 Tax=Favolaschia claudopus TaxID=2862362 RepID=A0AAW0CVF7_9AGAR
MSTKERYSLDSFDSRTVKVAVEGQEYRINTHFLSRDSPVLREMFGGPEVDVPEPAYTLDGVTKEELENLLWLYYNPYIGLAHVSVWRNILKLAEKWQMDRVRGIALGHLLRGKLDAAEKIRLCESVGRWQAQDAYVQICTRAEPLSAAEFQVLGMEPVLLIMQIRERLIVNRQDSTQARRVEDIVDDVIGMPPEEAVAMREEDYC